MMFRGEKPKNFKAGFGRVLKYLAPFRARLALVLLCAACSTVLSLFVPKVLAGVTNEVASAVMRWAGGGSGAIDFDYIHRTLALLLALYVASMAFSFFQGLAMTAVTTRVSYNLRNAIMRKINSLPVGFFNSMTHGEVLSRITNDVDSLSQNLTQSVTQAITTVTTIIGALALMASISWQLTLIALLMVPGSALCTLFMVKVSQKYFRAQQKLLGTVNGAVEEIFSGHTVVKAFNGEKRVTREFDEHNDALYTTAWKAQFLTGLMMPMMNFVGNLGYVAICMVGAYRIAHGWMNVGDIQAFITYIRNFTQPITQLANISSQLQSTAAAAERVFAFLDEEEETDGVVEYDIASCPITGDVTFNHVRFAYEYIEKDDAGAMFPGMPPMPGFPGGPPAKPPDEEGLPEKKKSGEPVIHDFSAEVKAGQKVAIVGPTGAGKTTIVKLLMRFHDLQGGAILVDGRDIAGYARRDLRSVFGMVLQDAWLFGGTIMENIRYGRPDASDEDVIRAAKAAQVDHFVRTLPEGYAMVINEETTNISQGQMQLLTIARAILADARILILDEATSSVDTRTETLIQAGMDNLLSGRTSFIIAHRLSTIRNADLILCMDGGDIVEQGSHDELLSKNGFYAKLYSSQFDDME
jgi:ATP-binding cassette subfamily B protein